MSVYIDRKYLGFVSAKLDMYKQKNTDLYNFRCPFCNDSKKNKLKARGYIYRKSNDYFYRCHNCGRSTTFSKFLQEIDPTLHRAYALERFSNGETGNHNYKKPDFEKLKGNAFARFQSVDSDGSGDTGEDSTLSRTWREITLESVNKLPEGHYAKDYIRNRKIPEKYWEELFFTPNFKEFLDTEFPEHDKENVPEDDRIVLCYTNEKGEVTNVAGRALSDTKIRYMTVKIKDEKKLFGLHRVKKDQRIYVFEGQFDSLFIKNSIASGDSNLSGVASYLEDCNDIVLVYDNEPRNKDIVKQIEKSIDNNYKVVLFPDSIPYKDVNEMVMNGMSPSVIEEIIDSNTFNGLAANLQFAKWKRC